MAAPQQPAEESLAGMYKSRLFKTSVQPLQGVFGSILADYDVLQLRLSRSTWCAHYTLCDDMRRLLKI